MGALVTLIATPAMADSVPPVTIKLTELPSGAFDVQWRVPKLIPARSMPTPRMPEYCQPRGERTFTDRPSAWVFRQVYDCPGGLDGHPVGIQYPVFNAGLSTLLTVEFQSGERYAHMLYPGEDSWTIPESSAGGFSAFLGEAREAVAGGARHCFGGWVHLAFLLVICLLGGIDTRVRLATVFLLSQMGGVLLGSLPGIRLDASLAEIGVALAIVLLVREALRSPENRKQLFALAVCAGVAHGLGMQSLIPVQGQGTTPGLVYLLLAALGMDAALLVSVAVLSGVGRFAPRRIAQRLALPASYVIAGACFALAIGMLVIGPVSATKDGDRKLELPSVAAEPSAQPGSRRLASSMPDVPFQSFVAIEAFEVRHEILVRLIDIAGSIGADQAPEVLVASQQGLKDRIHDLVVANVSLEIDGVPMAPVSERVDFVTFDDKGVLPRPEPVAESVADAWVGVTAVYLMPATARDVTLTWDFINNIEEIPATITDPEASTTTTLTRAETVLRWKNELTEDPIPTVSAINVEPVRLIVPLWSLVPLLAALFFAVIAVRRRPLEGALARVMLAVALLLGPVGAVAVAPPWSVSSTPGTREAKQVLARILPNVYRALEFREESAVFDQLAKSVTGETLSDVYLDHRKVLEMEERGGARARVEAVEVMEVGSVESADGGGFSARSVWTVGGTVTHFGHRHFRQNRYDARVVVTPDAGVWKLQSIELLEEQRLR